MSAIGGHACGIRTHSAEFVWQAINIVESAQYDSAVSTHAAHSSHKLFYIVPLKLVASEHGLHLAGNRSGEGNSQHVSPAQRHKTTKSSTHSISSQLRITVYIRHSLAAKEAERGNAYHEQTARGATCLWQNGPDPEGGTAFPRFSF